MRALAIFAAQILPLTQPPLQFFSSCIVASFATYGSLRRAKSGLLYAREADDWAIVRNLQSFMCR